MSRREYNKTITPPTILPSEYRQLQYIESTGSQWIDTGIKLNPQIEWYLDVQWLEFNTLNSFGAENWQTPGAIIRITNDNRNNPAAGIHEIYGINVVYGDAVSGRYIHHNTYNLSTERTTFLVKNGHQFINDIEVSQAVMTITEQYRSVLYFAERVNNTIDYYCKRTRHYYSYFKENNVTIREFIPALRLSDNKPGLYDTINNQFYTNAGSGEFSYA